MSYCAAFCVTENAYKGCTFAPKFIGIMKIEKFKVLLYLKKSGLDKKGKATILVQGEGLKKARINLIF